VQKRSSVVPGTGLSIVAYAALVAGSVALFLFVGGALWSAPREASHVARFAVSYLAVIPVGALLLLLSRRFSTAHLVATTGSVWALKMVITVVLYQAFARGTATEVISAAPPPSSGLVAQRTDYRPAAGAFASGKLHGHVMQSGKPVASAIVYLDAPGPGNPVFQASSVDLVVQGSHYEKPLYLVQGEDRVRLINRDSVLHTLHFHGAGRLPANRPLPPSAEPQTLELPDPGFYQVRCDNHPGEGAWIVVADHPYVTTTGEGGEFTLSDVPVGQARLVAVAAGYAGAQRADARATVVQGENPELTLDLADLRASLK
jgi:plastocyanin